MTRWAALCDSMNTDNFATISAPDFDLALTLDSGQTFHWEKVGAGFVGAIGERAIHVEQSGGVLKVRDSQELSKSPTPKAFGALPGVVAHYFALDHPLGEICA